MIQQIKYDLQIFHIRCLHDCPYVQLLVFKMSAICHNLSLKPFWRQRTDWQTVLFGSSLAANWVTEAIQKTPMYVCIAN